MYVAKIKKEMCGLRQAVLLVAPFGYKSILYIRSLWKHGTGPIIFCLCMDDVGVKYFHKDDVNHLITTLQILLSFFGLDRNTLVWAHPQLELLKYMSIFQCLHILQMISSTYSTYSTSNTNHLNLPIPHTPSPIPTHPPLIKMQSNKISHHILIPKIRKEQIISCLLYYTCALDNNILVALNRINQTQAKPTITTKK